jgi:hypothetical protein
MKEILETRKAKAPIACHAMEEAVTLESESFV